MSLKLTISFSELTATVPLPLAPLLVSKLTVSMPSVPLPLPWFPSRAASSHHKVIRLYFEFFVVFYKYTGRQPPLLSRRSVNMQAVKLVNSIYCVSKS